MNENLTCKDCLHYEVCGYHITEETNFTVNECPHNFLNKANYIERKQGQWDLETHSFYVDTWDESSELCVYILAKCSVCGKEHNPKEVFSKHLYSLEDGEGDYKFNRKHEEEKALGEFKQKNYKFQNYCPECGAKMN